MSNFGQVVLRKFIIAIDRNRTKSRALVCLLFFFFSFFLSPSLRPARTFESHVVPYDDACKHDGTTTQTYILIGGDRLKRRSANLSSRQRTVRPHEAGFRLSLRTFDVTPFIRRRGERCRSRRGDASRDRPDLGFMPYRFYPRAKIERTAGARPRVSRIIPLPPSLSLSVRSLSKRQLH